MVEMAVIFKPVVELDDDVYQRRIRAAKAELGSRLMILGIIINVKKFFNMQIVLAIR